MQGLEGGVAETLCAQLDSVHKANKQSSDKNSTVEEFPSIKPRELALVHVWLPLITPTAMPGARHRFIISLT